MAETSLPAIAWHNLSYQTSTLANFQIKSKSILTQLSGAFHYGTLNALMGPSGSGKTTLLNCLSGKTASSPSSCIYRNSGYSGTCCFIEQNVSESIIGQLTVRQLLNYAFQFKNGPTPSETVLKQHTRQVLEQLMLPEVLLDRKFSACSGGEQKRIAIGQELMCLNKAELLLVDEPTTGLDSTAALEVIHCLKQLTVKSGLCIVASIHQPNVSQLKLFDCLYVLAKGGVAVYSGPPGAIQDQLVLAKLVPNSAETPPIEVLLKAACDGLTSPAIAQLSISTQTTQNTLLQPLLPNMTTSPTLHQTPFTFFSLQTHLCRQFRLTFLANCRTQLFFALLYILNYTMVATIFRSTSSEAGCLTRSMNGSSSCTVGFQEEIEFKENAFNLCYTVLYVGLVMIYSSTVDFTANVQSLQSEHRNDWYSLPVFYLSTLFTSFINLTLTSLLISTLAYFFTSQHAADEYTISLTRYAHFTLFIWILCLYVQGIGHLVGVLLQAYEASFAAMASNILYLCLSMVNGFFVNTDISGNWLIISGTNLVALKFISRGLVYSIYGIDRCETGEESIVLQFLNVNTETVWSDCWWILGNMAFLRLTTFLVLYCKFELTWSQQKKNFKPLEGVENPVIIETSSVDPNPATEPNVEPENDSLPFPNSIILAWRHLHLYTSQSSSFFLQQPSSSAILNNLNGHFRFGTLNALMGTSGAGKTSLLKVLNGQLRNRVSGSFYLNSTVPIETTFITQDISGHLLPGLTVRQSVLYASKLKNRDSIIGKDGKIDHEAIVDNLLVKLGLEDTAGTRVERCSGGERKRIALALELASKVMPNLVFIDEPTSGLDSNSAEIVVTCLRNLTRQHGITIIASIHQPNTEILRKFDQLYVLALGGHCIYSGPPTNIAPTLNSLNDSQKPELTSNQTAEFPPIETLIALSCSPNSETLESLIKLQNQTELEANSQLQTQTVLSSTGPAQPRSRFSLCACAILFHRYVHYFTGHQWKYTVFYYANYLGYALFLQLFFNFEMVHQDGCLDLVDGGALLSGNSRCSPSSSASSPIDSLFLLMDNLRYTHFFSVFYLTFIYLQAAFDTQRELQYFLNEHRNGWYSSGTFYLLKCLTEAGPLLLLNLLYVYLINYYEFIRPGGLFWGLYLVLIVASVAIQGIAHILALLTHPNIPVLALLSITVTLFTVLLDDYLILTYRLHYVYAFLANFSIPRWTYEAIIMLQYGFGRCGAEGSEKIQTLFYMMKIDDSDYTWNLGMLLGNLLLFRVIALWLLVKKANRGREESSRERGERLEKWSKSIKPTEGIIPGISCSGGELPNIL